MIGPHHGPMSKDVRPELLQRIDDGQLLLSRYTIVTLGCRQGPARVSKDP